MIHVCFGLHDGDGRYSKFTGTTICSLFENCDTPPPSLTVHILHDNTLTQDNRDKFIYLAGRYGQRVNFYNVEALCADKLDEMLRLAPKVKTSRVSVGAFFRLLIPQLLAPEIDKCIYLDSDIIVNLDISELWRVDLADKILGVITIKELGGKNDDPILQSGFVREDDYFNSGVLLMNLNLLRGEYETLIRGLKFISENPVYQKLMDQPLLNYCFSTRTLKLPPKFNKFIWVARKEGETFAAKKIYHYTSTTLKLNMNDPFNRLWMNYFIQTPWFDADTIGRLYAGIQQLHVDFKALMVQMSAIMSGKKRAFVTIAGDLEATRQIFAVRPDEEIILFESPESLPKIIDAINHGRGQKIFFVMLPGFPFEVLTDAGFVYGGDFLNGFDFLSEAHGVTLDSHRLLKKM